MFFKVFIIAIFFLLVVCIFFLFGGSTNPQNSQLKPAKLEPAHFEHGSTKIVKSSVAGLQGGLFNIGDLGTPIDGTTINIPGGALEKEYVISIGYNDGKIRLASGKSSGVVLVLEADDKTISFSKPVTISVRFDPSLRPKAIVGYEIDNQGRFHVVDFAGIDKTIGTVSFYTFKPLIFTWAYIMEY